MPAYPTFPIPEDEYHQARALSLLYSEWEEVGHTHVKHQQMKKYNLKSQQSGLSFCSKLLEAG